MNGFHVFPVFEQLSNRMRGLERAGCRLQFAHQRFQPVRERQQLPHHPAENQARARASSRDSGLPSSWDSQMSLGLC